MSLVIEEPDKIDLDLVGYEICGVAKITTWYGHKGEIEMNCQQLIGKDRITKDDIIPCINDAGFGAQSIDGAHVSIYALYGDMRKEPSLVNHARKFVSSIEIKEDEVRNAKRGI